MPSLDRLPYLVEFRLIDRATDSSEYLSEMPVYLSVSSFLALCFYSCYFFITVGLYLLCDLLFDTVSETCFYCEIIKF